MSTFVYVLFVYIMTLRWQGFGLEAGLPRKSANTYGGKAVVFSSIVLGLILDWLVLLASCLAPSGCGFELSTVTNPVDFMLCPGFPQ